MDQPVGIVLAAGKSTRMKTERPKVLIPAGGRPMIEHVLDALRQAGVRRIVVVVGYKAPDVQAALEGVRGIEFVLQDQQLGTGDAVQRCRPVLAGHLGSIVVLAGDQPLIRPQTIRRLLDEFHRHRCACVLGTALVDDPFGLGRIIRDADGNFFRIVEQQDATPEEAAVKEVNVSCYVFDSHRLWSTLEQLRPDNAQRELFLTDCPNILRQQGHPVIALPIVDPIEALGVNTPEQLAQVDALWQELPRP